MRRSSTSARVTSSAHRRSSRFPSTRRASRKVSSRFGWHRRLPPPRRGTSARTPSPSRLPAPRRREREDHVSESVARAATTAGPSVDGIVLDDVDLNELGAWEQGVPYEWLTLLRREAPLFWQPEADGRGYWVFTRYDDIVQVSKDWESYSSELGGTSLEDLTPEEVEARKSMLDTDPPAHTRLRALVNKGFTPRVVNTYEEG